MMQSCPISQNAKFTKLLFLAILGQSLTKQFSWEGVLLYTACRYSLLTFAPKRYYAQVIVFKSVSGIEPLTVNDFDLACSQA